MVRLDASTKRLLRRVADLRGMSTSDYVRGLILTTARHDLAELEHSTLSLSATEQRAFWAALQEPVRLTPAQRKLAALMRRGP